MSQENFPIVKVENIFKSYKNVNALNGIDLEIFPAQFVALLGPNGAGKTTLVEIVEGIQKPDKGNVILFGKTWHKNKEELYKKIGLSFQETRFEDKLTVLETLKLFASLYNISKSRVNEILEIVNLKEKYKSWVVNLSGGQRQKLALGIALLNKPELLILDEPTTGLDPTARREIWTILLSLKKQLGTSMILTTHYMEEAENLCDNIVIIDHGKILTQGTLKQLINQSNFGEVIEFKVKQINNLPNFNNNSKITNVITNNIENKVVINVKNTSVVLPDIINELNKVQCEIYDLHCRYTTLDDLFINMTGRKLTD